MSRKTTSWVDAKDSYRTKRFETESLMGRRVAQLHHRAYVASGEPGRLFFRIENQFKFTSSKV